MKKLSIFLFVSIISILGFNSCKDVESSPVMVDVMPKATITGYVTAEMDLNTLGKEAAPDGTKLYVEVKYSELNTSASDGKWSTVIEVKDGKYSVEVPASATGSDVTIKAFPFEAIQKQLPTAISPEITMAYEAASDPYTVSGLTSGSITTQDITYDADDLPINPAKVRISGKVFAELDNSAAGKELVNSSSYNVGELWIKFSTDASLDSVKVENGKYSIEVAKGKNIKAKAKFVYKKNVYTAGNEPEFEKVTYEYELDRDLANFTENKDDEDLSFVDEEFFEIADDVTSLTGKLIADLDLTKAGQELVSGQEIHFSTATWSKSVTTNENGEFTVSVPRGKDLNVKVDFKAKKRIDNTTREDYVYKTDWRNNQAGPYYSKKATLTIDLGAGEILVAL